MFINRSGKTISANKYNKVNRESGKSTPRTIAALVPAYNEAERIGCVIHTLCSVEWIDEIIVIDDGSQDGTGEAALRAGGGDPRVCLIRHESNRGKGEALFSGWQAANSQFLLLLDADLINFDSRHVRALAAPLLKGEVDMTVGVFRNGYWRTDLSHRLTPWLSGQRCLARDLVGELKREAAAGYGFETTLTILAHQKGARSRYVPLDGVSHPPGEVPRSGWHGPKTKVKMYREIVRAWMATEDWRHFGPNLIRRGWVILLLMVTFGFNLLWSCSVNLATLQHRLPIKGLENETFWSLLGKLKAALDLMW